MRSKENGAQDCSISLEVSQSADDDLVVCCSRGDEDLYCDGCAQCAAVVGILEKLQRGSGMALVDVMSTLRKDLCVSAMNQGIAVLCGKRLCVVRREGGSWPFAVVIKRNEMRLCHAYLHGLSPCTHALAAREAGEDEQSEASRSEGIINGLGRKGRRHVNLVYSSSKRPLVQPQNSKAKHAAVLAAAATGEMVIVPAP